MSGHTREEFMSPRSTLWESPLRLAVFHILLALHGKDRHGLGIADDVEQTTHGIVRLGPGTLYRSLKEMTRSGIVEEVPAPHPGEDPRRKFYRITEAGRELLRAEASRYDGVVELARRRQVLPEAR